MDWKTALLPLIAAACALLAALVRSLAPSGHFFHTKVGLMVLSLGSGILDGGAEAIRQHGLDAVVLIGVVTAALLAAAFQMNTSIARDGSSKIPSLAMALAGSWLLIGRILVVVLACAMALPGCGTTGAQIRKDIGEKCGAQNDQAYSALKDAVAMVLTSGLPFDSIEHALLMLGPLTVAGIPAVVCMVRVVVADMRAASAAQPKDDVRAFASPVRPDYDLGVANGEQFLAKYGR